MYDKLQQLLFLSFRLLRGCDYGSFFSVNRARSTPVDPAKRIATQPTSQNTTARVVRIGRSVTRPVVLTSRSSSISLSRRVHAHSHISCRCRYASRVCRVVSSFLVSSPVVAAGGDICNTVTIRLDILPVESRSSDWLSLPLPLTRIQSVQQPTKCHTSALRMPVPSVPAG